MKKISQWVSREISAMGKFWPLVVIMGFGCVAVIVVGISQIIGAFKDSKVPMVPVVASPVDTSNNVDEEPTPIPDEPEFIVPSDEDIRANAVEIPYSLMGSSSEEHELGDSGYVDALVTHVRFRDSIGSLPASIWLYASYLTEEGYDTRLNLVDEDEVTPEAWGVLTTLQPDQGARLYFVRCPSNYGDYFTLKCADIMEPTFTNSDVRASYESRCAIVPYKDILRSPSDYARPRMAITLKIAQTMDDGFRCYAVDGNGRQIMDEEWYLVDTRFSEEPKLLETDVIQVYGTFIELVGVQRALTGTTDEIPKIQGLYIDIIG